MDTKLLDSLAPDQAMFLLLHQIPLSRVFDAAGMKRAQYSRAMKDFDMLVAVNTTPCNAAGHTMRTRHGLCLQCDTSRVAYMLRGFNPGWLYLATSPETGLTKVGVASDPERRMRVLSNLAYGGASDWELVDTFEVANAGRVEAKIHARLASDRVAGTYWRDCVEVECYELFNTHPFDALAVIMSVLKEDPAR